MCANNGYRNDEIQQKNLFQLDRIIVNQNAAKNHTITNVVISSSPFNLISFGGFTEIVSPITTVQTFLFFNITMSEISAGSSANLIEFSGFTSEAHHMFSFALLTFSSVTFSTGGTFFDFQHTSSPLAPLVIANSFFLNNRRGYIKLENSDLSQQKIAVLTDSVFSSNMQEQEALISVKGNSLMQVLKSTFQNNYSLATGSVLRAEGIVSFEDSVFMGNYALKAGVLMVGTQGTVLCNNCTFLSNFAIESAVFDLNNAN